MKQSRSLYEFTWRPKLPDFTWFDSIADYYIALGQPRVMFQNTQNTLNQVRTRTRYRIQAQCTEMPPPEATPKPEGEAYF